MLNKLKSMLPLPTIIIALCFAVYFGYEQYQDKKAAQLQYEQLKADIDNKEQELARQYKISVKAEQAKLAAENQSLQFQDQLHEALKDNQYSNVIITDAITNKLQQRANNIRQAATNTHQSIK